MAREDAMRNCTVGWMTKSGFACIEHATPKEMLGRWVVRPTGECVRHKAVAPAKPKPTHPRRKTG